MTPMASCDFQETKKAHPGEARARHVRSDSGGPFVDEQEQQQRRGWGFGGGNWSPWSRPQWTTLHTTTRLRVRHPGHARAQSG